MKAKKTTAKKIPSKREVAGLAPRPSAIKLEGYYHLDFIARDDEGYSQRFDVRDAILRKDGNELVIDCDCALPGDPSYVYTITLRRESALVFRGEWTAGKSADRSTGTCSCRAYSNGSRLALIGAWHKDGGSQQWIAELSPIEAQ